MTQSSTPKMPEKDLRVLRDTMLDHALEALQGFFDDDVRGNAYFSERNDDVNAEGGWEGPEVKATAEEIHGALCSAVNALAAKWRKGEGK